MFWCPSVSEMTGAGAGIQHVLGKGAPEGMHSMVSQECHVQSCLDHVPVEFLVQGFLFTKRTEWRPVSDKQPVASGRRPAVFR